jgi:hypothetical protein
MQILKVSFKQFHGLRYRAARHMKVSNNRILYLMTGTRKSRSCYEVLGKRKFHNKDILERTLNV